MDDFEVCCKMCDATQGKVICRALEAFNFFQQAPLGFVPVKTGYSCLEGAKRLGACLPRELCPRRLATAAWKVKTGLVPVCLGSGTPEDWMQPPEWWNENRSGAFLPRELYPWRWNAAGLNGWMKTSLVPVYLGTCVPEDWMQLPESWDKKMGLVPLFMGSCTCEDWMQPPDWWNEDRSGAYLPKELYPWRLNAAVWKFGITTGLVPVYLGCCSHEDWMQPPEWWNENRAWSEPIYLPEQECNSLKYRMRTGLVPVYQGTSIPEGWMQQPEWFG